MGVQVHCCRSAAQAKVDHHRSRLKWWTEKRDEILTQIKSDGLQVSESLVAEYAKTGYMNCRAKVTIDPDMQEKLNECVSKQDEHKMCVSLYDPYVGVLSDRSDTETLELNPDDWTFFFGK